MLLFVSWLVGHLLRWLTDFPDRPCLIVVFTHFTLSWHWQLPACSTAAVWRASPLSWSSICSPTCPRRGSCVHGPLSSSLAARCRNLSWTATLTPPMSCCGSYGPFPPWSIWVWSTHLLSPVLYLMSRWSLNALSDFATCDYNLCSFYFFKIFFV